jgi:hypothetical protein
MMADDPTDDRTQYDETTGLIDCPKCDGPLTFDELLVGKGVKWWCSKCAAWVKLPFFRVRDVTRNLARWSRERRSKPL